MKLAERGATVAWRRYRQLGISRDHRALDWNLLNKLEISIGREIPGASDYGVSSSAVQESRKWWPWPVLPGGTDCVVDGPILEGKLIIYA